MADSLANAELDATHVAAATATHIDDEHKVQILQAQLERCNVASARIQAAVVEDISSGSNSSDGAQSAPTASDPRPTSNGPINKQPRNEQPPTAYMYTGRSKSHYSGSSASRLLQLAAFCAAASTGPLQAAAAIPAVMCGARLADHFAGLVSAPDRATLRLLPTPPPGKY